MAPSAMQNGSPASVDRKYDWSIRHPFTYQDNLDCVAVIAMPWSGLLPRWRFVLPAEYKSVIAWGTMLLKEDYIDSEPRGKIASAGAVQMQNGPLVIWMGATQPLSKEQGAVVVFKSPAPHYIMFGQAPSPTAPPDKMEGITFGEPHDHPSAPV